MLDELELKQRYRQYQREVAEEQLYRQLPANRAGLLKQVWPGLGALLIAAGERLRAGKQAQAEWQTLESGCVTDLINIPGEVK